MLLVILRTDGDLYQDLDAVGDCPLCREPRNRHLITGKLVNVEQWHKVFTGLGRSLKPSDEFKTVSPAPLRPLIAHVPAMKEGMEAPRYKLAVG